MPEAPRKHTHRMRRVKQHRIADKNRTISNVFKGIDRDGNGYITHKDIRKTARWQKLRLIILRRYAMCYDPFDIHEKYNEAEPSTDVHHIEPLRTHHHLAFTSSNLVGLCNRCHMKIENIERSGKSTRSLFKWSVTGDDD